MDSKTQKHSPILVGMTGGSASGKTTLLKSLASYYAKDPALILHMDHYYLDQSHLSEDKRKQHNFDHPSAIEQNLLIEHVRQLKAGHPIERPTYDFVTHSRLPQTETTHPRPLIFLDGIFSLYYETLRNLLDFKVYVHLDDDLRFIRRLTRDTQERGREPGQVISQYLTTVRPMHKEFIEPTRAYADLVLSGEADPDTEVHRLAQALARLV